MSGSLEAHYAPRTALAQLGTFIYYAFFLGMPWYTKIDTTKPVPERVTDGHGGADGDQFGRVVAVVVDHPDAVLGVDGHELERIEPDLAVDERAVDLAQVRAVARL